MQSHGVVWFDEPQPSAGRLSRDRIVEAAIELADADVRGEVTMRAVATRLGSSTPMSLYRYVGSKDGLTDLMLDRVTAEIVVPAEGTWQERLRGLALSARAAVQRHPWFARLTFSRPPLGPHSLAVFDAALAALEPLGVQPEKAPYNPGGRSELPLICFVADPDGYRIELIDGGRFDTPQDPAD